MKMRKYRAYLSVSASGPIMNEERKPYLYDMRTRAVADLAFTTADVDFLETHWATEKYDTAPYEHHSRLANPSTNNFIQEIDNIKNWFEQFMDGEEWDGGCLTLSYAGHGREADGALVLRDGDIDKETLLQNLLSLVPDNNDKKLRLNILLDSCYSGDLLLELHHAIRTNYDAKFHLNYSAAACMHDEVAREYRSLGHGLFTYCFSVGSETPDPIVAKAIQPDNSYGPSLSIARGPYGCSFLTQGAQNPVIIDRERIYVCGEEVNFYSNDDELIDLRRIRENLVEIRGNFRYLFGGFQFPNGNINRYGRITNEQIIKELDERKIWMDSFIDSQK